ncbi:tRNA-Thr(GGU) m(6)t(6)A37 methyltransferase TsaA [Aliiruegeria haliotis]|uniref:tRNA-Thr(GGU) m(6)t(6)A37 methyltransferase TsaA n=1 Tax=Aliiruegeria haliotis TaxID=1280846 RepID=A0A2T0S046_9RHOB|nr:TrmO family methyltransferase [Aliiruegeria haliotis]PRY26799.1 tRNA-Thr(GGU) m(6)t(6)A37 methyltransferase TsaA [Aliiruegeria haliotis]
MSDVHGDIPPIREGEKLLDFDPAESGDATLAFIGTIRTPWRRGDCPKNIGKAREAGQGARIDLAKGYADGLTGLRVGQPVMLLYWMNQARRDLIQQMPRHVQAPRGTFALRSPNRPNPVAMSAVTITSLDPAAGMIGIDAIDCFDMTPLIDMKPWLPSVDTPAGTELVTALA